MMTRIVSSTKTKKLISSYLALIILSETSSFAAEETETPNQPALTDLLTKFLQAPQKITKEVLTAIVEKTFSVSAVAETPDFPDVEYAHYKSIFSLPKGISEGHHTLIYSSSSLYKSKFEDINLIGSQIDYCPIVEGNRQSNPGEVSYIYQLVNINALEHLHEFKITLSSKKSTYKDFYLIPKGISEDPASLRKDTLKRIVGNTVRDKACADYYSCVIPGSDDSVFIFRSRSLNSICVRELDNPSLAIAYQHSEQDVLAGAKNFSYYVVNKDTVGVDGKPHIQNKFFLTYFKGAKKNPLYLRFFGEYLAKKSKERLEKDSKRPPSVTINAPVEIASSSVEGYQASFVKEKNHKRGSSRSFIATTAKLSDEKQPLSIKEVETDSSSEEDSLLGRSSSATSSELGALSTRIFRHTRENRSNSFDTSFLRLSEFTSLKTYFETGKKEQEAGALSVIPISSAEASSSNASTPRVSKDEPKKKGKKMDKPTLSRGTTVAHLLPQKDLIKELEKRQKKERKNKAN